MLSFPVNFLPLEEELKPVMPYLEGKVLNAGCGDRDISSLLLDGKAMEVINCDIVSSIPGAIICDLSKIPLESESFDSVLCNAVLEHVPHPDVVMSEFRRLLKPGGNLVISVPFLQPYHPTPTDFRRFTFEGIKALADNSLFTITELRSVHSLAQTLGWITWAYLEAKGSRVGKLLAWGPIYILTRIFTKDSGNSKFATNSFQAVLKK